MEIIWHPNPLRTRVVLDDRDKTLIKANLRIEELEEHLSSISFLSKYRNDPDKAERLEKLLPYDAWCYDEESEFVKRRFQWVVEELETGTHCGDCTCMPASCGKCHAEELLGINTIKGIGKHELYKIDGLFMRMGRRTKISIAQSPTCRVTSERKDSKSRSGN